MYLSIGMSYDEFWNMDVSLVKYYREAFEIQQKRRDEEMWLQGLYVYKAVGALYPLFNFLSPKDAQPYLEEPFSTTMAKEKQELANEEKTQAGLDHFMAMVMAVNKMRQGGEKNGGNTG